MDEDSVKVYDAIVKCGGSLGFNDKADPEIIKKHFDMSKMHLRGQLEDFLSRARLR